MFPAFYAVPGQVFAPCRRYALHERNVPCTGAFSLPDQERSATARSSGLPSRSPCRAEVIGRRAKHGPNACMARRRWTTTHAGHRTNSFPRSRTNATAKRTRRAQGRGLFFERSEEASCAKLPGTAQGLFLRQRGGHRQKTRRAFGVCGGFSSGTETTESRRIRAVRVVFPLSARRRRGHNAAP